MTITLVEHAVDAGKNRDRQLSAAGRRAQGVVHTPAELARFALHEVDLRLRAELACPAGLADARVALLDPAVGTGVWLAAALERIVSAPQSSSVLLGFDVDPEVVESARALFAASLPTTFRAPWLSQANTLELADPWGEALGQHVRVIVGNPPWAARSPSRGLSLSDRWLSEFRLDAAGRSLGERRSGVLSDDYVRFFRWALEQARTSPAGAIVCLASNSSFLDGPVHRGMRAALLHAFDELQILDLGGNALRGGDGTRDDNLFGVRVGACLTLAVRRASSGLRSARVSYGRLSGSNRQKRAGLSVGARHAATYFEPLPPYFRLTPPAPSSAQQEATFSIAEALPFHREGLQSNRDALVTDSDPARLEERLRELAIGARSLPAAHLSRDALRALLETEHLPIEPLAYRPLDDRCVFAAAPFCHRPRAALRQAVARSSLCLLSARKDRGRGAWTLFGVSRAIADGCYLSTRSSCRTRVFPSHDPHGAQNLEPRLAERLSACAGHPITSSELIAYAVGVLSSCGFRQEHDAALHLDYPRLPWPTAAAGWAAAVAAGEHWVRGWLDPVGVDRGGGTPPPDVAGFSYDSDAERLWADDYAFENVTKAMWSFQIGDFPILSQLGRRGIVSLDSVASAVARVRMSVKASEMSESAYLVLRGVR